MKTVKLLGEGKMGKWSLAKDMEHARIFFEKNGCIFSSSLISADFVYCPWHELLLEKKTFLKIFLVKFFKKKKVAVVLSNGSVLEEKNKIEKLSKIVDIFVVPSKKAYDIIAPLSKRRTVLIPFYADSRIFRSLNLSKTELCKKLNFDYSKIKNRKIIGSFQRDSLGTNLNLPKWQKDPNLLVKILKKISRDDYLLLLAGPRRHYIVEQCRLNDIPYIFYGDQKLIDDGKDDLLINNLNDNIIALLYNLSDIYIVSSKSEGGPKAILEAALTKTPVISTRVGLAGDFLHQDLLYNTENEAVEAFSKLIYGEKREFYIKYNYDMVCAEINENAMLLKYKELLLI